MNYRASSFKLAFFCPAEVSKSSQPYYIPAPTPETRSAISRYLDIPVSPYCSSRIRFHVVMAQTTRSLEVVHTGDLFLAILILVVGRLLLSTAAPLGLNQASREALCPWAGRHARSQSPSPGRARGFREGGINIRRRGPSFRNAFLAVSKCVFFAASTRT